MKIDFESKEQIIYIIIKPLFFIASLTVGMDGLFNNNKYKWISIFLVALTIVNMLKQ